MKMMRESVEGGMGWIQHFSRADFDKWLGEYDVSRAPTT